MSNPTDTNQASEDMVDDFYSRPPTYRTKENLRIAIRTEKLKLLAEVRERVVGEDEDRNHRYNENWKVEVDAQNYLRKEQRTALNKLEAEL